MLEPNTFKV